MVALILLLPLLPWIIQAGKFYYGIHTDFSDLAVSHLPNAIYLTKSLTSTGEIPFWSALILGGAPFAGDPLAGLWYPFGWLAYPFAQPLGFNLALLLHLFWGGFGMVVLLLRLGLRREAAILGGMAFELMPKIFAHVAGGHITLIYATAWIPWLMLSEEGRQVADQKDQLAKNFPGLILGLIFLADPRGLAIAGLGWLMFSVWRHSLLHGSLTTSRSIILWMGNRAGSLITATGISAVLLMPMLEFVQNSTRDNLKARDIFEFSLPPGQLMGLIFPSIGGFWEWMIYPGTIVTLLLIYTLAIRDVRKKAGFWLIMAVVGLGISLGSFWPGSDMIAKLPFVSLLRVPSRAWLLTGFSLAAVAAYALDHLLSGELVSKKNRVMLIWVSLAAICILFPVGFRVIIGQIPAGMAWSAVAFSAAVVVLAFLTKSVRKNGLTAAAVALLVADLAGFNLLGMHLRDSAEVMGDGAATAGYLAEQSGLFRVYSPSYSIPQQTAAAFGLELTDGVNPLQLKTTAEYMSTASGVQANGYSVTVPAFANGDPLVDNKGILPNTEMLGLFNVRYLVAAYPLESSRLIERWTKDGTVIYENADFKPRIWVQDEMTSPGEGIRSEGTIDRYTPNLLSAEATGPGLLVLSEVDYPARTLWIDGKPVKKLRIANLLIGAKIDSGVHKIQLIYRPRLINLGLGISSGTMLTMIGLALWQRKGQKKGRDAAQ